MSDDSDSAMTALREKLEEHFISATALEVVYFGGGLPGARRTVTPLRYSEERGRDYIIALCHRSGIEKTFRLDRMHLPALPLADERNDFRSHTKSIANRQRIEIMLSQIANIGNLPIENALAAHLAQGGDYESFFAAYPYGGYKLELHYTLSVIYLSLGFVAWNRDKLHYEFTQEIEPRLTSKIATRYALYTGKLSPHCDLVFKEIKKTPPAPRPPNGYPKPETTPGVFLEHFDLGEAIGGKDSIVYRSVYEGAKEAAALSGWAFRSYSSAEMPATRADFIARGFKSFPTLILYRDGAELGRLSGVVGYGVTYVLKWASALLGDS